MLSNSKLYIIYLFEIKLLRTITYLYALIMEYSSSLMVSVLRREYPDIAETIANKIRETLPDGRLIDLNLIGAIVWSFKKERGIQADNWTNVVGKRREITYERELLIAVLLLFYDPEKIMQLKTESTLVGVLKKASVEIGTSRNVLCYSVQNVIVAFKAYEDFRKEVYRLYELIKIENNFFE